MMIKKASIFLVSVIFIFSSVIEVRAEEKKGFFEKMFKKDKKQETKKAIIIKKAAEEKKSESGNVGVGGAAPQISRPPQIPQVPRPPRRHTAPQVISGPTRITRPHAVPQAPRPPIVRPPVSPAAHHGQKE